MASRRFTPPWDIDDNGACFIIRDSNGQALNYVYYENEPGRRTAAGLLTRDEARRIAINIAKLPELLPKAISGRKRGRLCGSQVACNEKPRPEETGAKSRLS